MRRVLFVDDEPRVLEGLENMLFPFMGEWDMSFVSSGEEALSRLSDGHFDVLVTDMRMPEMDGVALLCRVKERHPDVVRIVLSGQAELSEAVRAMPMVHRFLSKPCDVDVLVEAIDRACGLRALITDRVIRSVMGGVGDLPARPATYSQLVRALVAESASTADIAKLIERDIGISTKILQVVNTAFFSRGQPIKTVQQAVPRLGVNFVRDLALAVEVFREFTCESQPGFSVEQLHNHSFRVAMLAKGLARDPKVAEDAFLAGFLHDIGHLILATALPGKFCETLKEWEDSGQRLYEVEERVLGVSHAEIGAYLLGLWGLDYHVCEAVANHHRPSRVDSHGLDALGCVYVANMLIGEMAPLRNEDPEPIDISYLRSLGVLGRLQEWRELCASIVLVGYGL